MPPFHIHKDQTLPPHGEGWIWVFGSNLAGRHGMGAAKMAAIAFGAKRGKGFGFSGHSFAIPTKDHDLTTLPLDAIAIYVMEFIDYARKHPKQKFWVTRIGCGLAGYADSEIAPMFAQAPITCSFAQEWQEYLS